MQKIIWNMGQMNGEQMAEALGVSLKGKKIKKVCSLCGSEEVLVDAYAQWDVEKQKFVLNSTFERSFCFCNACERECQIIDEEMKYGE